VRTAIRRAASSLSSPARLPATSYLELKDFQEGRRSDPSDGRRSSQTSRAKDMLDLADYFAAQKPKPLAFRADAARVARGKKKAEEVLCTMCHLEDSQGRTRFRASPASTPST